MKNYYYVKVIADDYDKYDNYLCEDGVLTLYPAEMKIFDNIDDAITAKNEALNYIRETWHDYPSEYMQIIRL